MDINQAIIEFFKQNSFWVQIIVAICQALTLFSQKRYFARNKLELDKQLENHKHELQAEFLKTQMKTTQLFAIYPELFAKIKMVHGELFALYGSIDIRRDITSAQEEKWKNNYVDAHNFFHIKLLFISESTKELAKKVLDKMFQLYKGCNLSNGLSESEVTENFNELKELIGVLEQQMKTELSGISLKISNK